MAFRTSFVCGIRGSSCCVLLALGRRKQSEKAHSPFRWWRLLSAILFGPTYRLLLLAACVLFLFSCISWSKKDTRKVKIFLCGVQQTCLNLQLASFEQKCMLCTSFRVADNYLYYLSVALYHYVSRQNFLPMQTKRHGISFNIFMHFARCVWSSPKCGPAGP